MIYIATNKRFLFGMPSHRHEHYKRGLITKIHMIYWIPMCPGSVGLLVPVNLLRKEPGSKSDQVPSPLLWNAN